MNYLWHKSTLLSISAVVFPLLSTATIILKSVNGCAYHPIPDLPHLLFLLLSRSYCDGSSDQLNMYSHISICLVRNINLSFTQNLLHVGNNLDQCVSLRLDAYFKSGVSSLCFLCSRWVFLVNRNSVLICVVFFVCVCVLLWTVVLGHGIFPFHRPERKLQLSKCNRNARQAVLSYKRELRWTDW